MEPATLATFAVAVGSTLTAAAATFAARYVRESASNSEKALRVLTGEPGVDEGGLVAEVGDNRNALLMAGLYPPREEHVEARTDGGEKRP